MGGSRKVKAKGRGDEGQGIHFEIDESNQKRAGLDRLGFSANRFEESLFLTR